jgi:ferrous-iron efflux pump FieF
MANGAPVPVTDAIATVSPEERGALMRRATYASVAVAGILIVTKTGAWAITDSVSVLSSLLDSLLDAAASIVNLIAVRHALAPADAEHRFGHGKAEALAGLAQAAFIGGSALLLLSEAVHRLWTPVPVESGEIGIAVMALSLILTIGLVRYQLRIVKLTGSLAVGADRLHYTTDILLNGAVIASLLASVFLRIDMVDPIAGLAIGVYILWSSAKIARAALDHLMDRELPEETREKIIAIARANPLILDVHDLRTRAVGPNISVQMHLEIDGNLTLNQAHGAADAVEEAVMAAFPGSDVIVHMDPAGIVENRRDAH